MRAGTMADRPAPLWLLDDGGLVLGGGQLFALRLARSAGRGARSVTLACPEGSPLWRAAREAGVAVADVPFPAPDPRNAIALRHAAGCLRAAVPAGAVV